LVEIRVDGRDDRLALLRQPRARQPKGERERLEDESAEAALRCNDIPQVVLDGRGHEGRPFRKSPRVRGCCPRPRGLRERTKRMKVRSTEPLADHRTARGPLQGRTRSPRYVDRSSRSM